MQKCIFELFLYSIEGFSSTECHIKLEMPRRQYESIVVEDLGRRKVPLTENWVTPLHHFYLYCFVVQ